MTIRISEVVMKLAGPIHPVGEYNEDARRLENLKTLTKAVDKLLFLINQAAESASRPEASMAAIGQHAKEFLNDTRDALEDSGK